MKIKDLPKVERPREKLEKYGPEKLSNTELLAILLRSGGKDLNVIELSKKILTKFSGNGLAKAKVEELKNTYGLGAAKACEIVSCFELGNRLLKNKKAVLCITPDEVWQELKDICNLKKEHFVILFLDVRNQVIQRETISVGTLNASLVHPREVFEPAVRNTSAQIILAHNHPSGDPAPSEDDLKLTKRLVEAGKILGIEVIDHVVVVKDRYYSFKEEGILS